MAEGFRLDLLLRQKNTGTTLSEEKQDHALDDLSNSAGAMGAGFGHFLYDGRNDSSIAGHRTRRSGHSLGAGTQSPLTAVC